MKALDFDASRETAMSTDLGQYRIVHFATHSLLNNQQPELSGVVLSLVDRAGPSAERISAAVRYLQSAARGGSGRAERVPDRPRRRDQRAKVLIGLTRGFLYAGAPRVVATFGRSTIAPRAELMKHFYEGMLVRGAEASRGTEKRAGGAWGEPRDGRRRTIGQPSRCKENGGRSMPQLARQKWSLTQDAFDGLLDAAWTRPRLAGGPLSRDSSQPCAALRMARLSYARGIRRRDHQPLRKKDRLRERKSATWPTYSIGIARMLLREMGRDRAREARPLDEAPEPRTLPPDPEDDTESRIQCLRRCLRNFPPTTAISS